MVVWEQWQIKKKSEKYQEKYNSNPKKCKNCYDAIEYKNRHNIFCSHNCAASYNNKNRQVEYSVETLENLKRIAELNFKNKVKKEIKKNINLCQVCFKEFITTYKNKNNKNCSKECKNKWHSLNNFKQNKTFGKCGYYRGIFCASSWELAFLIYNLDLNKDIKRCEHVFKYKLDNQEHLYFPDFMMEEVIYEIKGRELEDVALKTKSVIEAGHRIEIIRKKQIEPMIKYIKEKYKIKDITKLYDVKK